MALPETLRSGAVSAPTTIGPEPTLQDNHRPTVLIVDDSVDNRALLRAFLKHTRFEVDEAENGVVAVAKVKARKYDFVLMDLLMPKKGGFEATREIRQWEASHGSVPTCIIAFTAWALSAESLQCGADLHLAKPTTKAKLLEVLNSWRIRATHG
jgi:CheY-like chemotaxis protein